MFIRLFLLFTLLPALELSLLIAIGSRVGVLPTLALILLAGVAGASLARREGMRVWLSVNRELSAGRMPAGELMEAFLVLIAGVLLVTPGVITDLLGVALLIPPVRRIVSAFVMHRLAAAVAAGHVQVVHAGAAVSTPHPNVVDLRPDEYRVH